MFIILKWLGFNGCNYLDSERKFRSVPYEDYPVLKSIVMYENTTSADKNFDAAIAECLNTPLDVKCMLCMPIFIYIHTNLLLYAHDKIGKILVEHQLISWLDLTNSFGQCYWVYQSSPQRLPVHKFDTYSFMYVWTWLSSWSSAPLVFVHGTGLVVRIVFVPFVVFAAG